MLPVLEKFILEISTFNTVGRLILDNTTYNIPYKKTKNLKSTPINLNV